MTSSYPHHRPFCVISNLLRLLAVKKSVHVFFENSVVTTEAIRWQFLRPDLQLDVPRADAHVPSRISDAEASRFNSRRFLGFRCWIVFQHGARLPFTRQHNKDSLACLPKLTVNGRRLCLDLSVFTC